LDFQPTFTFLKKVKNQPKGLSLPKIHGQNSFFVVQFLDMFGWASNLLLHFKKSEKPTEGIGSPQNPQPKVAFLWFSLHSSSSPACRWSFFLRGK